MKISKDRYMSDYIDFLLYGSLESSDSDDSDYIDSFSSQDSSSQYSSSQDLVDEETLLKLYHNYNIYGL